MPIKYSDQQLGFKIVPTLINKNNTLQVMFPPVHITCMSSGVVKLQIAL